MVRRSNQLLKANPIEVVPNPSDGVSEQLNKPFEKVQPGYRPLLSKGTFVPDVRRGPPGAEHIVGPWSVVRNGAPGTLPTRTIASCAACWAQHARYKRGLRA